MQLFQLAGLVRKPLNAKQETALAEKLKAAVERKMQGAIKEPVVGIWIAIKPN